MSTEAEPGPEPDGDPVVGPDESADTDDDVNLAEPAGTSGAGGSGADLDLRTPPLDPWFAERRSTAPLMQPDDRPYAWAEVDLGAIEANTRMLVTLAAPARVCAVVKAWGYGHGSLRCAEAALRGGASWLGVALVQEAAELRAHLDAPILVLAEPPLAQLADVARLPDLRPTVYTSRAIRAAASAVRNTGRPVPLPVHLKVDTGMHRVGASPEAAVHLAELITAAPELVLEGLWTHLATADDPHDGGFTGQQLATFEGVRAALRERGIEPPIVHTANSGGTLMHPESRYDLVRPGIAVYGIGPANHMPEAAGLVPAMALKARVSFVKRVAAGEGISYGLRHRFERPSVVATVPIGYHDGVPRRLGLTGGEVLIGGRRRPIVGVVTMDQLMVDCGDDESVRPRDEVVLFGRQGSEEISAWDWAERVDTIAYEIVCGISVNRVPRRYR
jgi:alanine racemase